MIFRFPPARIEPGDQSFLTENGKIFAKLKIEQVAGKRTVFLTEHTLIFVIKGVKLLHFPEETIRLMPHDVALLKKGIYVMAEYIEEGLSFEALLLFLPVRQLQDIVREQGVMKTYTEMEAPFLLLSVNEHIQLFKNQVRHYFENQPAGAQHLFPLKQTEILLLLLQGQQKVLPFLHTLVRKDPRDIEYVMRHYLLKPLSIPEYADLCNQSLSSFKREFQRIFHSSPRQWINQQRLAHAHLLIQNTDLRVAEIAAQCGFESVSYFIRSFKYLYGCTPVSLRTKITME